jgi:D-alanyl-D-alanine carboxypeptidase
MLSSQGARIVVFILMTAALSLWPGQAGASAGPAEARARAVVEALSAGDPERYERVARENFSPSALARRTPGERAAFVATIHADFGALSIEMIDVAPGEVKITASGKGGKVRFIFGFEPTPEQRINALGVERVGEGADSGPTFPLPPINASMSAAQLSAALETWLKPFVQNDDFAGVVLVAKGGTPVFVQAYGPADREARRAADTDTAYNVASIGKKLTQVAIARLIQEGRLTPATKLGDIISDYPDADARTATVDQLLNMQGGISDFFGPGFEAVDKSTLNTNHAYYKRVSALPQRFKPGTKTEYCNGCYVVLGEMIERISGKRFEDFIAEAVLRPAGMKRTGYFNTVSLPPNTAGTYARLRGPTAPYESTRSFHGTTGSGAGGVYSTAMDLLAFDNALRDGRLLNAELTAWTLGGARSAGRNMTPMGIAGGAPGMNALLESDGNWTVIITANVDAPLPERLGVAIAKALKK